MINNSDCKNKKQTAKILNIQTLPPDSLRLSKGIEHKNIVEINSRTQFSKACVENNVY